MTRRIAPAALSLLLTASLGGAAVAGEAEPTADPGVVQHLSDAVSGSDAAPALLDATQVQAIAASPCSASLAELVTQYVQDPRVPAALNAVVAGLQDPPAGYAGNPWKAAAGSDELLRLMVSDFIDWCVFLPQIEGDQDNGLYHIQRFAWFYYQNDAGQAFVQGRDPINGGSLDAGASFLRDFSDQRGTYMSSPASTTQIADWIADPRIEIEDYQRTNASEYTSFNDFFARSINIDEGSETIPSRPATMPLDEYPERDYIVVAPTDCIMNALVQVLVDDAAIVRRTLDNPLQHNTVLDVKGIPLRVDKLLGSLDDDLKQQFVGGTGLSCVLMPNTYHYFHSPVNGTVIHREVIKADTFGYYDWPNWVPTSGNVGRAGTDFGQFEAFERGVIVIEVKYRDVDDSELTGYVASIPVGLDTIGSVVLDPGVREGDQVKRGYTRLGNFYYGGSLNILLFSEGLVSGAVQTRLGNQIALFNVGTAPSATSE